MKITTTLWTVTEMWPGSTMQPTRTHFSNEGEAYDYLQQSAAPIRELTSEDKETIETKEDKE